VILGFIAISYQLSNEILAKKLSVLCSKTDSALAKIICANSSNSWLKFLSALCVNFCLLSGKKAFSHQPSAFSGNSV